ncbi:YtxH domain-containing protein [Kitasatospora nipponensis]|uniref:YtxH domain-containing protein n=1 Tax=Kitasatospora nipponensis TaxID=258049 RepID=A0ABN1VL45_9ACTN
MWKLTFVVGAATGYVLGARAGRQRYEQIAAAAQKVARNPKVQDATQRARVSAGSAAGKAVHAVTGRVGEKLPDAFTDRVPYFNRARVADDSWGTVRS